MPAAEAHAGKPAYPTAGIKLNCLNSRLITVAGSAFRQRARRVIQPSSSPLAVSYERLPSTMLTFGFEALCHNGALAFRQKAFLFSSSSVTQVALKRHAGG